MAKNKLLGGMEGAFTHDMKDIANHNFRDISLVTTQLDMVTGTTGATLTNIPGMVTEKLDPGTYSFTIKMPTVATANTGIKIGFKFGTASMLASASYSAKAITASGIVATNGTAATDQALLLDSAAGVVIQAEITGVVVVTVAGTLQLQAAQHTAHADTTSILVNGSMDFQRITTG